MRPVCERSYKREAIGRAFARCDLAHNRGAYPQAKSMSARLKILVRSPAKGTCHGPDFLTARERLNVVISRGEASGSVFDSSSFTEAPSATIRQTCLVNSLCALTREIHVKLDH